MHLCELLMWSVGDSQGYVSRIYQFHWLQPFSIGAHIDHRYCAAKHSGKRQIQRYDQGLPPSIPNTTTSKKAKPPTALRLRSPHLARPYPVAAQKAAPADG